MVRLTDHPNMTLDVDCGRKTIHNNNDTWQLSFWPPLLSNEQHKSYILERVVKPIAKKKTKKNNCI